MIRKIYVLVIYYEMIYLGLSTDGDSIKQYVQSPQWMWAARGQQGVGVGRFLQLQCCLRSNSTQRFFLQITPAFIRPLLALSNRIQLNVESAKFIKNGTGIPHLTGPKR